MSDEIVPILRALGVTAPAGASHAQLIALMRTTAKRLGVPARSEHTLADLAGASTTDITLRRKIKDAYRPVAPESWSNSKSSKWLSSDDIEIVMRQYETSRPDFKFIGVSPIDFADRPISMGGRCVSPEMCALDVPSLVRGGRTAHLGVVLNMDKHDSSGSHWVGIYIGLSPRSPNYGVFYYDSVATPPNKRVTVWMRGIAKIMRGLNTTAVFQVAHNKVRRQFGQSECGIFAMMFLIHCMHQVSGFKEICQVLGGDDVMKVMRTVLFRPSSHRTT